METKLKILVIEDDKYISNFLLMSLKKDLYDVSSAASANEGMFLFSSSHPDIVLLDLGLPDRDGIEVIHDIRNFSQVPILVISARGQEHDKIEALDAGADDYITKPFYMGELMARIRVSQRKLEASSEENASSTFVCDWLCVDYTRRRVTVDGRDVHLTPMEYQLLTLMIANRGRVLTHNYITKEIWGYETDGDTRTVRVFMANLRRKIEHDTANPRFIFTEIGVGYRFADE